MNLDISSFFRVIGIIMMVLGVSMIPSFVVSLIYDDPYICKTFLITILSCLAVGTILTRICKHNEKTLRVKDGFLIVTVCWFISGIIGAVPFVATGSIPNPVDAFFESCSGFSTTGASILSDVEVLPRGILFWRSFTHWIGGMGILVFAIALMPSLGISGQNIAVSETPGPTLDKTTAQMSSTAKSLYLIYIVFTLTEVILLMLGGLNLYDALIHSFGTVGTGGFSSYNSSIAHFDSTYVKVVITLFMAMCGVNFNLYYMSLRHGVKSIFKDAEFRFYLLIILASSAFIFIMLCATQTYTNMKDAAVDSCFQTVTILTTTGYASADFESWPIVCQTLLLMLMFVGGCSASTSGGLKAIRILIILKLIRRGVAQRLHPKMYDTVKVNGKTIPSDTVTAIASHFFLYLVLLFVGTFLISFENEDMMTCFSSVMTCLGNVGPGVGSVGPTDNFGALSMFSKMILSIYMIAGRLELYTLFILLTPRFWNQNH